MQGEQHWPRWLTFMCPQQLIKHQ